MTDVLRVVYVDHGRVSQTMLRTVLDDEFDVVRAETGTDAIKRLHHGGADAVVVPADLPDLDLEGFAELATAAVPGVLIFAVGEDTSPPDDVVLFPATATDRTLRRRFRSVLAERRVDAVIDHHRRLESATLDVLYAALVTDGPEAVESALYDRLTGSPSYEFVLAGRYVGDDGLQVSQPVEGRFTLDEVASSVGADGPAFLNRAVRSGDVAVAEADETVRGAEAISAAEGLTTRSLVVAAVPLATEDRTHGVLLVGTRRPNAFDGTERELLGRLGALVGRAMASTEASDRGDPNVERLGGILRALAHEISGSLQVATDALAQARGGDEAAFSTVADAHERIGRVVDSVVAMAGLERVDEVGEVDLQKLVLSVWGDVRSDEAELTIARLPTISADRPLLELLLSNLLRNAVEHAGPQVSVRLGALDDRGGFYVEDDGPGIPPDRRERVFEWGVSDESDESGGTGVGLGLVREVCTAHGWQVRVTDGRDGGARFEVVTDEAGETADEDSVEGGMVFGSQR